MKRLLAYLFLVLGLELMFISAPSQAEDISDFEIEGMSIGDSALDFFSEIQIKNNSKNYYTNKKYIPVQNDKMPFFKTYDAVDFAYKNYDNSYTIVSLAGILIYEYNIQDCYKKMDEITEFLDGIFSKPKKKPKITYKFPGPLNVDGKSIITEVEYKFKNGDAIIVACYDYSKEFGHGDGAQDHLSVAIDTASFDKWLTHEAHN